MVGSESRATLGMTVRRKYRNPPITEAICEFRFEPGKAWDWTIPGLVYSKIKDEFPLKQQENALEISLTPKEGKITQELTGSLSKMQFLREDKRAMVQVGPDLLSVNLFPPYSSWDHFQPLIAKNLQIYREEANPKGVRRIGLRYINKIQFSSPSIELMDFFNFYPRIPEAVQQRHGPFAMRVMMLYGEEGKEGDALNVRMGHLPLDEQGNLAIALDLDYYLAKQGEVNLDQVMEWVNIAHDNLEVMFEACMTDRARALCGAEERK